MAIPMSAARVDRLLSELCVDLAFCLPPDDQARLRDSPPSTIDAFTDAVFGRRGWTRWSTPHYANRCEGA